LLELELDRAAPNRARRTPDVLTIGAHLGHHGARVLNRSHPGGPEPDEPNHDSFPAVCNDCFVPNDDAKAG
jgi:hypothetical protein